MRCTLKWVYDLLRSGQIKAKKIGGRWHIPKTEIEERLKQRGH
jgi:excisionase family DNA binding protein